LTQSAGRTGSGQQRSSGQLKSQACDAATGDFGHSKPLELFPNNFFPWCDTLEKCLLFAVSPLVLDGLLSDMPLINRKYQDAVDKGFIQMHNLSEVEAKCIIMLTHESSAAPSHAMPLHPLQPKRDNHLRGTFNKACVDRDFAVLQKFKNFSFHFLSALQKLPNVRMAAGQSLYCRCDQRLHELHDVYEDDSRVWWHRVALTSVHPEAACKDFSKTSGTLIELTCVHNAKDIQELSLNPTEGEVLVPLNTEFKIKLTLSSDDTRKLKARHAAIPDGVDLVILEAAS
jgi:hypothetical protein